MLARGAKPARGEGPRRALASHTILETLLYVNAEEKIARELAQ
jgi:hypothetical protein